jgi:hypothetical protein
MAKHKIRWLRATCPVCGERYEYIEGNHKPSACNKFQCIYHWHHYKGKGVSNEQVKKAAIEVAAALGDETQGS